MLFFILLTTSLWTQIFCNNQNNSTQLEELFKKKYMRKDGYKSWKELEEQGHSQVLEDICKKFSEYGSKADNDTLVLAAGEKTIRNSYGLRSCPNSMSQLDTIKCSVSLLQGERAAEEKTEVFYLAEGDEPNSAFQFTVDEDLNIIRMRKFKDVWPKPEYELDA